MAEDFWYGSQGRGTIHGRRWLPQGQPKAVVQIIHGIAEFVDRYDAFAQYLTGQGYLVVAQDHMGHGQSVNGGGIQGYFHGGWFAAAEDCYRLLLDTAQAYPHIPYVLFGHSMGSFLARTILCRHPDSGIQGAILCGTGWQNAALLPALRRTMEAVCRRRDETKPSPFLQNLVFGSYNRRVEHPRTAYDWLTRDRDIVDAYIAHPLCGFVASAGLLRDMIVGIDYIERRENLAAMCRNLPVLFISGEDDPVGSYGKGVRKAADAFRKAGMADVQVKLYPLCRHEILNEINRQEVFQDVTRWIQAKTQA